MKKWSVSDIPRQTNKVVVITGANSGIGYETALAFARAGAEIIMAGRSAPKNQAAIAKIKSAYAGAKIVYEPLDLASLTSITAFTARLRRQTPKLDILINNAGLMALPTRQTTQDGFEMQFGTNFLGHFALTAQLLPLFTNTLKPRVVQLSSIAHRRGAIDLSDLQATKSYRPWKAYSQSKLAMLMFALELQRRSAKFGWGILSTAAHPGFARTEIVANGPGTGGLMGIAGAIMAPLLGQSAAAGALPTLYAATAPGITPGFYAGPQGFAEMRGPPAAAKIMPQAHDVVVARKLWDAAEALTGAGFITGQ